jgi:hypothetical protein
LILAANCAISIRRERKDAVVRRGGGMKGRIMKSFCVMIVAIIMLAPGARAQSPDEGQIPDQRQAPGKEEKSKPKEFQKIFCAERSVAQRFMRVDQTDCNDVCDDVYRDYPCTLQQRLNEGWKVTSVSTGEIVVVRDPCECRVSGTESVLERN